VSDARALCEDFVVASLFILHGLLVRVSEKVCYLLTDVVLIFFQNVSNIHVSQKSSNLA